ncbi:MAG TPA: 2-dehydropantoate 2-reductase [Phycisphaerae bacterium]|nr:2-dehydropantoate 2-reductase [Phycisphaerae bacterium]HOQ86908.1 2-dehydropantoate 2-reductase [Phycisphaerae bacterium]HPP28466.1 2-dehydropantoate 2-reductase [Phycisphaerae bacterium]
MKIAVIGSGAVGCYYGARLVRAGHDVHFLMRRDLDAVRRGGLRIESAEGSFHLPRVQAYDDSRKIGPVDLVLCALKATAMDVAEALIRPCMGPATRVLAMMNGLGIEERFGEWFEPWRIFGGMAFVCINRGDPGVVQHFGYGRIAFGHLLDDLKQVEDMARLFADAGFETMVRPSLRQARWEKLMWNIPFSTLAVTAGGVTTQEIIDDPGLNAMARRLIVETGEAGNADGCRIDVPAVLEKMMANTATMGRYRPSMLVDYENRLPLEVEAILGEPVRRARRLNFPVPTIEAQYWLTSFADKRNRGLEGPSK